MDNVVLAADGSVGCRGYAAAPAIADVAALLGAMLPENTIAVSDELRTTIARVLGIVDPPPFESVEALSRSLEQFETGDRREVVRQLLARTPFGKPAAAARPAPGETTFVERRRGGTPRSELRRQLREADRRLYEEQQRRAETPPSADAEAATRGRVRF